MIRGYHKKNFAENMADKMAYIEGRFILIYNIIYRDIQISHHGMIVPRVFIHHSSIFLVNILINFYYYRFKNS